MVHDDPDAALRKRLLAQQTDPTQDLTAPPVPAAQFNTMEPQDEGGGAPPPEQEVPPYEPPPAPEEADAPPPPPVAPPVTPAVQPEQVGAPADPFAQGLNALYQQYAQRDASAGELNSHRGNPGGLAAVEAMLKAAAGPTAPPPPPAAAKTYAPVQGFDATKMADPNYSSAKYTPAARAFAAGQGAGVPIGRNNLQPSVDYAKANGFPNARVVGDDKIDYGDGNGPIDVIQSNGSIWFQNGQDRFGGGGAGSGAGGAAAGGAMFNTGGGAGGGTAGGGGTSGGGAPAQSDFMNQLRSTLLAQIAQAQTPVDENALQITAPLSAARDEVSRSSDAERKALAEHAYATGDLHSSTLGQQMQQSAERNAGGLSQLRAGLISNEYKQKRDELQSYLQLAVASGDAELARQVQMEMANLNAAVQREGQGINLAEFLASLNQRSVEFAGS